jgi:hypothetical protein
MDTCQFPVTTRTICRLKIVVFVDYPAMRAENMRVFSKSFRIFSRHLRCRDNESVREIPEIGTDDCPCPIVLYLEFKDQ